MTFHDDGTAGDEHAGDRLYEAFAPTTLPAGTYVIHVTARGTSSTGAFRRTAAAQFRIMVRDAQITSFADFGVDDDFDFYYDHIIITTQASITTAGKYQVSVRLRAANGRELQHTIDVQLPVGSANSDVSFTAAEIQRDLAVAGPYSVAEIRYSHVLASGDTVPADIRYNLGATAAYTLDLLAHSTLRLAGNGTAFGIDQDANGRFDLLQIVHCEMHERSAAHPRRRDISAPITAG
ncbi:MAG TPA: choice-of-anchor X domain-containing protein [Thermoanaerobaculia bacterium]|nr:choice-of-anchor X domain-containing protein [Thermoanaerobaculia bacterium]